ncbi:MAG TPA: hypothetical protein VG148_01995 [Pyrinomonadaceae bacterium]|nr:hypothetical protein [Pyrinomonadaceae bacterium]
MLPRTRPAFVLGWLLLVAAAFAHSSSHARQQQTGAQPGPTPRPPTIRLESDTQVVTLCPDSESVANPRVRLRAIGTSPDGNPIRYRWTVSGGQVDTTEGADVVWDLSGAAPGVYAASVTLETGPPGSVDPLCTAFTSTRVVVRTCPPPRPVCPNVSIYCPDVTQTGAPITFTASVSGGTAGVTPVYNWRVSEGTIISGQGTPSITVDTAGLGGRQITATVEVEGYNLECRASCQSSIPAPPVATHTEFGEIARDDEKARLDLYAIELQNSPGAQGYIIGYGGSRPRYGDGQRRADRAREYLVNQRGVEASRLVVINGGTRPTASTELWIVPPGANAPTPR